MYCNLKTSVILSGKLLQVVNINSNSNNNNINSSLEKEHDHQIRKKFVFEIKTDTSKMFICDQILLVQII